MIRFAADSVGTGNCRAFLHSSTDSRPAFQLY